LLVLLDATVLTNFGRVGLTSAPLDLWGDQVHTTVKVLDEYNAGIRAAGLPPMAWEELSSLILTPEEQAFAATMSQRLGKGERACLAIAVMRDATLATDDRLARRAAKDYGIRVIGTLGILKSCVQRGLLSRSKAQRKLDEMIAAGYYSPVLNLKDE